MLLQNAAGNYELVNDQVARQKIASVYGWPIGEWCVSPLTDFSNIFRGHREFNEPLDGWDVSKAVDLTQMFQGKLSSSSCTSGLCPLLKSTNDSHVSLRVTHSDDDRRCRL